MRNIVDVPHINRQFNGAMAIQQSSGSIIGIDMNCSSVPSRIGSLLYDQQQMHKLNVLIVGVGGIGCQLLKVFCKIPIGSIHIIDMDTIEISNLNRQFLFKAEHKGHSKALVAKETIKKINPYLNVEAHHKNIRQLPVSYFRKFNYLIMALDNIQTRNYVNRIGVRLNIPIIDAGTLGFKGNVHIIIPHITRCYSCEPKVSSQKSFPVCTIRMRPEKPIHCIVWAKMLFQVLFSGQEVNNDMKDLAKLAESGNEYQILKQLLYEQIINIKSAKTDSDSLLAKDYIQKIKPISLQALNQKNKIKIDDYDSFDSSKVPVPFLVSLAKQSFSRLMEQKKNQGSVLFEKDDDTIIHFVSSLANLRMMCFSIEPQSFNQVKNMAGNIVPAIASTNSIVSGLEFIEMIKLFTENLNNLRSYYIQNQNYKVRALKTEQPLSTCLICSQSARPVTLQIDMKTTLFKSIVDKLKRKLQQYEIECQFSINQGSNQLYNSQQPNKKIMQRKLVEISGGSFEMDLIVTNEDSSEKICTLWVIHGQHAKDSKLQNQKQIIENINRSQLHKKQQQLSKLVQQKLGLEQQDGGGIVEVKANNEQESDQIMITQVRKPNREGKNKDNEITDRVEKRIKQH